MAEWVIWVAFGLFFYRYVRGRRGWGGCGEDDCRVGHARKQSLIDREPRMTKRAGAGPRRSLPEPSPLESLQRRFVHGTITVEQYEAELDRLLKQPTRF